MSAISPTEYSAGRAESAAVCVLDLLKRISFQRRVWLVSRIVLMGLTAIVLMICILGTVDFVWPVSRSFRFAFVLLLFLGAVTLIGHAIVSVTRRRTLSDMAREVERAARQNENALVTFAESLEHTHNREARPYMLARLGAQAKRNLDNIDVAVVVPRLAGMRILGVFVLVLFFVLALGVIAPTAFALELRRMLWLEMDQASSLKPSPNSGGITSINTITIESVNVRVVPPSYTGLGIEAAPGDGPVRALVGSQIDVELAVTGTPSDATLGYSGAITHMRYLGEGRFSGSFIAQSSGAFETRGIADQGTQPTPIVRALEVYADTPPEVRITEPASDQLLRGLPSAPVSILWTARDDLGLSDVVLRYIRSRGDGDAAQFVNGAVPLNVIERAGISDWRGGAALDLRRIGMQAGDTLVYWIEARDRNPSANNTGRSASLAIAITAPEPVKLNLGDLGPNEIGRFLLSERMIIVHTEKLHAERARIPKEELLRRAQEIAAEQQDFKNSFNEYIKIEGAGEETHQSNSVSTDSVEERVQDAEAERTGVHMHGIPEPLSGSPNSVRDMVYAIRAMWDAEDALSLGDTTRALVFERDALTRLKRAQLAVRYVPPVAARSKPIDLKRRYAGELNEIKTRLERLSRPAEAKERTALRSALGATYQALAELQATLDVPVTARAGAVARARERTRQAANGLATAGGDHASTIAEALGQLRIVETELSSVEVGGSSDAYAIRVSKSMSLLTRAAASLFAIAEARTRANGGEASTVLPTDDRRTSDYFRRLNK